LLLHTAQVCNHTVYGFIAFNGKLEGGPASSAERRMSGRRGQHTSRATVSYFLSLAVGSALDEISSLHASTLPPHRTQLCRGVIPLIIQDIRGKLRGNIQGQGRYSLSLAFTSALADNNSWKTSTWFFLSDLSNQNCIKFSGVDPLIKKKLNQISIAETHAGAGIILIVSHIHVSIGRQ
jgi:hypothetical protein